MNKEPENEPQLIVNFNLFKFNLTTSIAAIILHYAKNNYQYVSSVYDSLLLIILYTNLIFIYIIFTNRHRL